MSHLSRRGVPRPRATVLAVGAVVIALAGCSSDEPDTAAPEEPTAAASEEPVEDAPVEDVPAADEEPAEDAPAADEEPVVVAIVDADDFAFTPAEVSVAVGDTVTWEHDGRIAHTVTADDDSFDSGSLAAGDTFTTSFDEAGTFAYVCQFHGGMTGTITVS